MKLNAKERKLVEQLSNEWVKLMSEAEEILEQFFTDLNDFGHDKANEFYQISIEEKQAEIKEVLDKLSKYGNPKDLLKKGGFIMNHILFFNHKTKQFILSKNSRLNWNKRAKFEERVTKYSKDENIEKVYLECTIEDTFRISDLPKEVTDLMADYKEVQKFESNLIKDAKETFIEADWSIVKENLEETYFTAYNPKKDIFLYVQFSNYFKLLDICTVHALQKGHGTGRTFKNNLDRITPELITEAEKFAESFFNSGAEKRITFEQFKKINGMK